MPNDRDTARDLAVLTARVEERFASQKEAIIKVEQTTEKRFESVNEFRKTLSDQASNFATRERVDNINDRLTTIEGKSSGFSSGWAILVAVGAGLLGFLSFCVAVGALVYQMRSK
jgi:hypothetical protein